MMRLREFIDSTNAVSTIKKECIPFLEVSNEWGNIFSRGMNSSNFAGKSTVRHNRPPKDMPGPVHEIFDEYFREVHGWPYRSASLFVTSDTEQASEYGDVHYIFPIGEFEVCWSNKTHDLYSTFRAKINSLYTEIFSDIKDNELFKEDDEFFEFPMHAHDFFNEYERLWMKYDFVKSSFDKRIREFIESLEYQIGNVKGAMAFAGEIMVKCDEYYHLNIGSPIFDDTIEAIYS